MITKSNYSKLKMCCARKWAAIFLPLVSLTGCVGDDDIPMLTIDSVSLYADMDANQNSALPIDLVLVYDPQVNKMISTLSAAKYFENAQQLKRDNPASLDVWSWELVPGQSVVDFEVDQSQGDAFDGYVFANYLSPGDHRLKVAPSGKVKILFLKTDMKSLVGLDENNVTQAVSSPQPLNAPTKTTQAHEQQKSQQIGRSTAEFQTFDVRAKGEEPDMAPPYVFQVEGVPNDGGVAGPIDLRPEDSKKGQGDTSLVFGGNPAITGGSTSSSGVPPSSGGGQPCQTADAEQTHEPSVYDSMPQHGPETDTHSHGHAHEVPTDSDCDDATQSIFHSHEHGHPHPLVGAGDHASISTTELEPPHGVND